MTLPATPFRKDHTLTGAIVPLLYDWKVENKNHLLVTLVNTSVTPNVETTLAVDTDYAVSGVGNDVGGNVTPTTAYTAGWKIAITSNVPYEQDTDFTNQNSVLPEEAESMADKIGRQVKQIVEVLSRCVKTTVGGGIQPDDLLDAINDAVAASAANAELTEQDVVTTGNNVTAAQSAQTLAETAQAAAESAAAGIKWRPSVRAATIAALPFVTYNNGASGVGATLTATANGAFPTIDGVAAALNNDYLVKNQVAGLQNGIYRLTQVGTGGTPFIMTRRTDADTWLELVSQAVIIEEGTTLADQAYICTVNQGGTIGTTGVTWGTFSPPLVIASQAEAEAGAENTKAMSALRVLQSIAFNFLTYLNLNNSGYIVGRAYAEKTAFQVITTVIPVDNTAPANTEGDEVLTVAYTPKFANSTLRVTAYTFFAMSSASFATGCLFRDAGATPIDVKCTTVLTTNGPVCMALAAEVAAAAAVSTTFRLRMGPDSNSMTVNGRSGAQLFNSTCRTTLIVEEIRA